MGKIEIKAFLTDLTDLTDLAVNRNVSSSTQNQAFNTLLFLYEQVLGISIKNENISALRAKAKIRIPTVLTIDEVKNVILTVRMFTS